MTALKALLLMSPKHTIVVALTLFSAAACSSETGKPSGSSAAAISSAGAEPSATALVAPPSASAAASSSAGPATVTVRYAGGFEAKKRNVTLPSGVSEPVWGLDKGQTASGPGKMELSVWGNGRVTGTASGSLGDLTIEGIRQKDGEDEIVTASVSPVSGKGFRGTLSVKVEGGELHGVLHVASDDTSVVREATLALKPSGP